MIEPVVRLATPADDDQIEGLVAQARAGLADRRGGARWLETHPADSWRRASTVLVAAIDELLVGYLPVSIGEVARVDEVFVMPEAREIGFGDALLAAAIATAREAGATVLEGEALPGDRHVKNLYERAGITARLITVSTEL